MEKLNLKPSDHIDPFLGKTAADYAVTVAKVGSLAFPPLAAGVAFIDLLSAPLRGKRMSDWCEQLRLRLNELSEELDGLTPEALASNEAFISAFAQATTAAIKTHQKEKLEALRNAVLNVAAGTSLADDLQTLFINLVDSFTVQHLLALDYLNNRTHVLQAKLSSDQNLIDQAVTDLNSRGMIQDTRPYDARGRDTGQPLLNEPWEMTVMGKQFLMFIKSPTVA